MEEAYSELYQQYLRLRSLCLKQAALLHQLTAALQKQQGADHKQCHTNAHCDMTERGAPIPDRESGERATQVQSTQETPVCLHEKPQQLTTSAHGPAAHCGIDGPHGHAGTFHDLLAKDMSKLCLDLPLQRKEDKNLEQNIAPLLSVDSPGWQGASFKTLDQAVHLGGDKTMLTKMMPLPGGSTLVDDFPCPSSGMLVSDVALQSHVCDFCQAVFPGNTTTRGEFLRHLHTHIT
ncbi:uncharacterized protein LOC141794715 [Halichoeres trimaculatus]|uniref:uncharacterized protein LOC141794715 n=1 Tax=Halichoeres trimaculatus TaxID=147232 RepID=UPI003D9DE150